MDAKPLCWPDMFLKASLPKTFLRDIPVVGLHARTYRHICRQLRERSASDLKGWGDDPVIYRCLCCVSPVVMKYFRWPNPLFIPDDPCAILLWDPRILDPGSGEDTTHTLEKLLALPQYFLWDDFESLVYLELIRRIIRESRILCDADVKQRYR
jgi:hypothetical protein